MTSRPSPWHLRGLPGQGATGRALEGGRDAQPELPDTEPHLALLHPALLPAQPGPGGRDDGAWMGWSPLKPIMSLPCPPPSRCWAAGLMGWAGLLCHAQARSHFADKGGAGLLRRCPVLSRLKTPAHMSFSATSPGGRMAGCPPPAVAFQCAGPVPMSSLRPISLVGRSPKSRGKGGSPSSPERGGTGLAFSPTGGPGRLAATASCPEAAPQHLKGEWEGQPGKH